MASIVMLGACSAEGDTGFSPDNDRGDEQGQRNGDCTMLPRLSTNAYTACRSYGTVGQAVADELVTLWQTDASSICAYVPSDGSSGACGPDLPNGAAYCPSDNSVAWDIDFMNEQHAMHGDFAPVAIVAHEWGHLNQIRVGFSGSPFVHEQNADCFSGLFAAVSQERGLLNMGDVMEAFSTLCEGGGDSGFFDASSHGSCHERVNAFNHGYVQGLENLSDLCGENPLFEAFSICEYIPPISAASPQD